MYTQLIPRHAWSIEEATPILVTLVDCRDGIDRGVAIGSALISTTAGGDWFVECSEDMPPDAQLGLHTVRHVVGEIKTPSKVHAVTWLPTFDRGTDEQI